MKSTKEISISYTEDDVTVSDTVSITVKPHELVSISVTNPDKTTYEVGETFEPAGMTVTGTYKNGDNSTIEKPIDLNKCSFTPKLFEDDVAGQEVTITVTYTEDGISKSDTVTVNVKQRSHCVTIKIANECREQGIVMYWAEFAVFDREYTINDVMPDDSITFSVQAKEGYSVDKVVSDQRGELLSTSSGPTDPKYTLTDVTKNETVTVYFKKAK